MPPDESHLTAFRAAVEAELGRPAGSSAVPIPPDHPLAKAIGAMLAGMAAGPPQQGPPAELPDFGAAQADAALYLSGLARDGFAEGRLPREYATGLGLVGEGLGHLARGGLGDWIGATIVQVLAVSLADETRCFDRFAGAWSRAHAAELGAALDLMRRRAAAERARGASRPRGWRRLLAWLRG